MFDLFLKIFVYGNSFSFFELFSKNWTSIFGCPVSSARCAGVYVYDVYDSYRTRMESVIRTGFKAITHNIDFNPQGIVKGKALAVCHVCRVEELTDANKNSLVMCSVIRQTSVTLPPYKVKLEVSILKSQLTTQHKTDAFRFLALILSTKQQIFSINVN